MGKDAYGYGGVLYKEPENIIKMHKVRRIFVASTFVLAGLVSMWLGYWGMDENIRLSIVFFILGLTLVGVSVYSLFEKQGELIIYEDGIRFTSRSMPFLRFSDIKRIEKRKGLSNNTPFMRIITKTGRIYSVSAGPMKYVTETPSNYSAFLKAVETGMERVNADLPKNKYIWDIAGLQWDEDAERELNKLLLSKIEKRYAINEKVLKSGGSRVTLEDYRKYA